jgi:hypothetical protein
LISALRTPQVAADLGQMAGVIDARANCTLGTIRLPDPERLDDSGRRTEDSHRRPAQLQSDIELLDPADVVEARPKCVESDQLYVCGFEK